jgi:choline dehydrogenase-like flavoprotein
MNAMIYIRGSRRDFDSWRDEAGCAGWGYADLMPYFLRAEDNSRGASAYHGTGGPLAVADLRYKSAACAAFIAAAQEQGAAANEDFNGPHQDGVGWYQVTQAGVYGHWKWRCRSAVASLTVRTGFEGSLRVVLFRVRRHGDHVGNGCGPPGSSWSGNRRREGRWVDAWRRRAHGKR